MLHGIPDHHIELLVCFCVDAVVVLASSINQFSESESCCIAGYTTVTTVVLAVPMQRAALLFYLVNRMYVLQ